VATRQTFTELTLGQLARGQQFQARHVGPVKLNGHPQSVRDSPGRPGEFLARTYGA
jgi:hypothetical protein